MHVSFLLDEELGFLLFVIMKIQCFSPAMQPQLPHGFSLVSFYKGEGILRPNYPLFLPDFSSQFVAHPCLVVRIGRTGKFVKERFAHKYIDGVGVGYNIYASDLLRQKRSKGENWDGAVVFEGSAACGSFQRMDSCSCYRLAQTCHRNQDEDCMPVVLSDSQLGFYDSLWKQHYAMRSSSDSEVSWSSVPMARIAQCIEAFSYANVIHTGDLLFIEADLDNDKDLERRFLAIGDLFCLSCLEKEQGSENNSLQYLLRIK